MAIVKLVQSDFTSTAYPVRFVITAARLVMALLHQTAYLALLITLYPLRHAFRPSLALRLSFTIQQQPLARLATQTVTHAETTTLLAYHVQQVCLLALLI